MLWATRLDRRRFAMGVAALPVTALLWPRSGWTQAAPPAALTAADIFVAESVPVDVTAASVTEARERGLTQGRIDGLRQVLERLVAREDMARVPQLGRAVSRQAHRQVQFHCCASGIAACASSVHRDHQPASGRHSRAARG